MFRLLVALVTVLTLVSAASQTAAQEVELCPAGDASLVATPSAAMIAALEASPPASPPAEPYGSPTATVAVSPTGSPTGSPTTAETCRVDIGVFDYMPRAIKIPVGTSVIWTNRHNQIHTATANDSSWDTDDLSPSDTSAPIVFDTPGNIPYHCDEHPEFMFGMIEVE
jgi:plastocyanin